MSGAAGESEEVEGLDQAIHGEVARDYTPSVIKRDSETGELIIVKKDQE